MEKRRPAKKKKKKKKNSNNHPLRKFLIYPKKGTKLNYEVSDATSTDHSYSAKETENK